MQSISHWGQFEIPEIVKLNVAADAILDALESAAWKLNQYKPTSFYVSRQDKPEDPKLHKFY
jgi:hypothetical protein